MSEKWDHVPEFKPSADRRGIVAKINTETGFEYSIMSLDRAREVSAESMALGNRYENDDPTTIGWALQWMAEGLDEAIAEAEPVDA